MSGETFAYGIRRTVDLPVDEADARIRGALAKEGFGILTEIDVAATFAKKLDVEFRPYRIQQPVAVVRRPGRQGLACPGVGGAPKA